MLEIPVGVFVSVALGVIAAWWALAKMFISQFERRQNERFDALSTAINEQKAELDGHMTKQDQAISETRRVENELLRSRIEAATTYQTKAEANSQHAQIISEIRAIGARIDSLQGRGVGVTQ